MKENIRFSLGFIARKLGCALIIRDLFLFLTKIQIYFTLNSNTQLIFRRSITGPNFTPFWSDIDLTAIIVDTNLQKLDHSLNGIRSLMTINPFIKDIELVDSSFFTLWENHSGFKNWKKKKWIQNTSSKNFTDTDFTSLNREEIGYNLVWEHRFLYEQINKKFHRFNSQKNSPIDLINIYKNMADIEQLLNVIKHNTITERNDILKTYPHWDLSKRDQYWLFVLNKFTDLTSELFTFLENIFLKELEENSSHFKLNEVNDRITLFDYRCLFVSHLSPSELDSHFKNHPADIIILTPEMYKIYKLCGIQEIDPLITLSNKNNYSFIPKYLIVRLLQDYLQAILGNSKESVLFFCRKNIDKFFYSRLQPNEALSYIKQINETDLQHYLRTRDKLLSL